jgi:FKBP-type peptidyl-prolyl cis-trans isomerase FklB
MQRQATWAWLLLLCTAPVMAQNGEQVIPPRAEQPPMASKADQSYAIGINIGRSIQGDDIQVDMAQLIAGLTDGLEGKKSRLTDEQLTNAMRALQREVQQRFLAKVKKEGDDFLAANKKKEGVVTLPSGLQYKVIKAGQGASPKATDTVNTHYHGTLIDGEVFDSSKQRGQPVSFQVNRVIPGWTEALQRMKVGDVWQLVIPSELAYGEEGTRDGAIPPHSVLVFEVELLGIEAPKAPIER